MVSDDIDVTHELDISTALFTQSNQAPGTDQKIIILIHLQPTTETITSTNHRT